MTTKSVVKSEEPPTEFKKGEKQQYAYDFIKDKIIKNIYKPQQLLGENDLSKAMGDISRTPIRDALRRLMYEGLVENLPGKGMFVSDLRFEDMLEIMEVRACLHTFAVRLFIQRAIDSDIEMLGEILSRHIREFENGNYMQAVEIDHQFHLETAKCTRNSRLYMLCQNYIDLIARASYLTTYDAERMHQSVQEHISLFEAIKGRDEAKAVDLQRAHFEGHSKYLAYKQINRHSPYSKINIELI